MQAEITLRQAAQQALEALEQVNTSPHLQDCYHAFDGEITALRAALAEPEQEPFMVVSPECAERGCMAHDDRVDGSGIVVQLRKEQEEVRRLHAELERKSDAIQRLWKERDELQALNAELVEALRRLIDMDVAYRRGPVVEEAVEKARAALAKVEASK